MSLEFYVLCKVSFDRFLKSNSTLYYVFQTSQLFHNILYSFVTQILSKVWAVDTSDNLYARLGISSSYSIGTHWIPIDGK